MVELEDRVGQIESDLALLRTDIKQVLVELKVLALGRQNPMKPQQAGYPRTMSP